MRIVLLGSTGRTGLRVIDAALARGAEVLALARDPDRLGARRDRVRVLVGDARDEALLRDALRPGDVLISALGASPGDDVVARGTARAVDAMEAAGVDRILVVVGAGVLLSDEGVPRHALPDYPPQFRRIGAQHQAALEACARSSRSWVVVGCPRIVDADPTGRLEARVDRLPPGIDEVTTGDLAALLVREALAPTFARTRIGVNQSDGTARATPGAPR
jgi:putative NADH-flavin reductase